MLPGAILEILRPYPFILTSELKSNFMMREVDRHSSVVLAAILGRLFIVFAVLSKCPELGAIARAECNVAALNMLKIDNYTSDETIKLKTDNDVKNEFYSIILNHFVQVVAKQEELEGFFCSILISIMVPLICSWIEGCISTNQRLQHLIRLCFKALEQDGQRHSQSSVKTTVALSFARSWSIKHTKYQNLGDCSKGYMLVAFLFEVCHDAVLADRDGDPKNRERRMFLIDALLEYTASVKRYTATLFTASPFYECLDVWITASFKKTAGNPEIYPPPISVLFYCMYFTRL